MCHIVYVFNLFLTLQNYNNLLNAAIFCPVFFVESRAMWFVFYQSYGIG